MHVAVIGSGPVGMTAALLLARQGHRVSLADRDPGPVPGQPWNRVGVMQFHLPHGFRHQCRALLAERLPDVLDAVVAAGAEIIVPEGAPPELALLRVRRSVFERALWECTTAEPGVTRLTGHVDDIVVEAGLAKDGSEDGRAAGIVVDSAFVPADLVIDASGRNGRLSAPYRPAGQRVECGMAYASRIYRLRPGAEPAAVGGLAYVARHPGYLALVFPHDVGTFSVLFVRPAEDKGLAQLRDVAAYEAACRVVPVLADWTDPERSEPIDLVRAGAGLTNEYAPQPTVDGLVCIGDAFSLTNPQGGRGITLGLQTAALLADLVAAGADVRAGLDEWGRRQLVAWFDDHVTWDASLLDLWAARPLTEHSPIGADVLVVAAMDRHPEWMATLGPYFGMLVQPAALEPLREGVRELVRHGWQPPTPAGPSRDELVAVISAATGGPAVRAA